MAGIYFGKSSEQYGLEWDELYYKQDFKMSVFQIPPGKPNE